MGFVVSLLIALLPAGVATPGPAAMAQEPSKELGEKAAATILRMEDRRELGPDLYLSLASPIPAIRARAALAAGRIGDPRAIDPLAALLRDPDPLVRANAAFALGEIEDSSASAPLAWFLRGGNTDARARALAVEGLGKLQATRFASCCLAALADSAALVREAACLASWQLQAVSAAGPLLALAQDAADDIRWKATYALMRMLGSPVSGRTAIPGGTAMPDSMRTRIRTVLWDRAKDPDARTRLAAVRGLGRFPDGETTNLLLEALRDPDWRVRAEGLRALGAPRPENAGDATREVAIAPVEAILSAAGQNPNVRIAAVETLGQIDDGVKGAGAARALERFLEGRAYQNAREQEVASIAVASRWKEMLKRAEGAEAEGTRTRISDLAHRLAASGQWTTRAAAASVIADVEGIDPEIPERMLRDEPRVAKEFVDLALKRRIAARQSSESALDAMRPVLDRCLDAPDPILRAVTIETAGTLLGDSLDAGTKTAWTAILVSAWKKSAGERENDVRLAIVGQLERITDLPEALDLLRGAARSADHQVAGAAYRSLTEKNAAGAIPPPGAIETGRGLHEYEQILRWAAQEHRVEIRTERGRIRLLLFSDDAPLTCWNFVHLAASGFYDRGSWHRVVPDFVVQDGCPRGDGYGGPGYQIRCEINEHRYGSGAVGMALSGKDTGGSQFFITHSPQPHLDGRYTVFGQVEDGMDVVDRIVQGDAIESIREIDR